MSVNTVRQYLAKNKYYAFRPRQKPFLTEQHKLDRCRWAKEHKNWKVDDWACVSWCDEATIEVGLNSQPPWVH